jgi:glycosyltransferase involved in cell wall biosynthesis
VLLQCLARAAKTDPETRFHFAGRLENVRFVTYFIHLVKEMGLGNAVKAYPTPSSTAEFLKPMNYCVSTNLWEGSPVSLFEAMACGIKPLVHRWKGALDFFPKEWTFASVAEFEQMAKSRDYTPQVYRDYVAAHFDARTQAASVISFLGSL